MYAKCDNAVGYKKLHITHPFNIYHMKMRHLFNRQRQAIDCYECSKFWWRVYLDIFRYTHCKKIIYFVPQKLLLKYTCITLPRTMP